MLEMYLEGDVKAGPFLVTAATEQELSLLRRSIEARELPRLALCSAHEGLVGNRRVIIAVTGMGKVNAALATTILIERYKPLMVINTGCAGAYHTSGLQVGHLAIAASEIYGDEGVLTHDGWHGTEFIGIPLVEKDGNRYYNEIPLSRSASERGVQLANALGVTFQRGKFVTVSTCSGTAVRGDELGRRFRGICENMEGAAVAHVALMYGVDCLEVRGVSNLVEDRDLGNWDIGSAVEVAQRFILKYIETFDDDGI